MELKYTDDKKEKDCSHEITISYSKNLDNSWFGHAEFSMTVWDESQEAVFERLKNEFEIWIADLQRDFYKRLN